jgi:NitT/TauT family transport system substrate-binding protein
MGRRVMHYLVAAVLASLACALPGHAATAAVDVALGDVTINKIPFLMAADHGIYARNGLTVRQFVTPEAAETARGNGVVVPADMVRADIDRAPISIGGGSPAIYNAVYANAPHYVVLATLEGIIGNHIIAAPGVRTVEELRGKRIGYALPGRATHIGLLAFARRMGWMPGRDIILVERASTLRDIADGRIDATIGGAVMVATAPASGLKSVADLSQYRMPFAGSGVMAERNWLSANRDTAARFVKATVEALALIKRDRAAFTASVAKWMNITDRAAQDAIYAEAVGFPAKPTPSADGVRAVMEMYDSPQMRLRKAEDFYDASFVTELDRTGYLDTLLR